MWNLSNHLNALTESDHAERNTQKQLPLVKFNGHKDEGYAIDWSPVVAGRLLSGNANWVFLLFT